MQQPQDKLVRIAGGVGSNMALDIHEVPISFGKWRNITLTEENKHFWIPAGFLHIITDYYAPQFEHHVAFNNNKVFK
jgi:dTDP-4-dehydrorhamnose 3,5-epimerase-like enzyme